MRGDCLVAAEVGSSVAEKSAWWAGRPSTALRVTKVLPYSILSGAARGGGMMSSQAAAGPPGREAVYAGRLTTVVLPSNIRSGGIQQAIG